MRLRRLAVPGSRRTPADPPADGPSARLGNDFLADLARDYRAFGAAAIADLRKNEPRNYFGLMLSLVPHHAQTEQGWFDGLTDEELNMLIKLVRAELANHNPADSVQTDTPSKPKSSCLSEGSATFYQPDRNG